MAGRRCAPRPPGLQTHVPLFSGADWCPVWPGRQPDLNHEKRKRLSGRHLRWRPFAARQEMRFPGICSFSPSPGRLAKEHWQPMAASVSLRFKAAFSTPTQRWETQAGAGSAAEAEVQQGCQQVRPGAQSSQTHSLPTMIPTHGVGRLVPQIRGNGPVNYLSLTLRKLFP